MGAGGEVRRETFPDSGRTANRKKLIVDEGRDGCSEGGALCELQTRAGEQIGPGLGVLLLPVVGERCAVSEVSAAAGGDVRGV